MSLNLDNNQLVCDSHMNCMLKDDMFRDVVVSSDEMRDAVVKDLMRDAVVKNDLSHDNWSASLSIKTDAMRDAVVKDLMRDAVVKNDNMRDAVVKDDLLYVRHGDELHHVGPAYHHGDETHVAAVGYAHGDETHVAAVRYSDLMRDAIVKDLMRDAIVKDDNMRDAIVKDLMRDAVVKNDLTVEDDRVQIETAMNATLKNFVETNKAAEAALEKEAHDLELKAKRDLAKAKAIKQKIIQEEKQVAEAVHKQVTAWRKNWDSKLKETDKQREAEDAAELKRIEEEEWTIKQRVVKEGVDSALKNWAKELAVKVDRARVKRIAADKVDRAAAIQHAIDVAIKKWQQEHDKAEEIRKARFEKKAAKERAIVLEKAAADAMKAYHKSKLARKLALEEQKARRDEEYDQEMDAKRLA